MKNMAIESGAGLFRALGNIKRLEILFLLLGKELNVGGIAKKEGSKQFSEVVYLTPQEEADLKAVQDCGCELFMQQLPTSKREELKL